MKKEIYLLESKEPGGIWDDNNFYGFPDYLRAEHFLYRYGWNRLEMPDGFIYINERPGRIQGKIVRVVRIPFDEDTITGESVYEPKQILTKEEILCLIQQ